VSINCIEEGYDTMMLYDEKQYEKSSSSSDEDEDKKTATKK